MTCIFPIGLKEIEAFLEIDKWKVPDDVTENPFNRNTNTRHRLVEDLPC